MNQIRFLAYAGSELVGQSDWMPERGRDDALHLLTDFRGRMGEGYSYRIERTGDSKVPNRPQMFRYRIKSKDNTYYSRLVEAHERDKAKAEIAQMFPKAEITEEAM